MTHIEFFSITGTRAYKLLHFTKYYCDIFAPIPRAAFQSGIFCSASAINLM